MITQEGNIQSRVKIMIRNKCLENLSSPLNNVLYTLIIPSMIPGKRHCRSGRPVRNYGSESCPVRCSASLRLETLLESAAGEMLSSAGKNRRQEGVGGGGNVCAGQDVKQPGFIISRALIMYDTGLMLYNVSVYDPNKAHCEGT